MYITEIYRRGTIFFSLTGQIWACLHSLRHYSKLREKLYNVSCCVTVVQDHSRSGVGTYLSASQYLSAVQNALRAVPLLKVGRLVMHFAVPLFGHRLHIALMKAT